VAPPLECRGACLRTTWRIWRRVDRPPLRGDELARIERELGVVLPTSLADLFTRIAAAVDVSRRLPDGCIPPPPFQEVTWGACTWDARRLPELERTRRNRRSQASSDPEDDFARVWMNKLAIVHVSNGDLIAVTS
jgi:hypothetical protein